jgi:hypothetical protein
MARWNVALESVGGGPWLVLRTCPSTLHNTAQAALRNNGGGFCICPRGKMLGAIKQVELLQRYAKERERKRQPEKPDLRGTVLADNGPVYLRNVASPIPVLPDQAACNTHLGRMIMDAAAGGEGGPPADAALSTAQKLCRSCPVEEECLRMVRLGELPAGSWGGYYAGFTANERKRKWGRRVA